MNLAIISPNQNAYSETFIQAHKKINADKVLFYYGGFIPNYLEGYGAIMPNRGNLNFMSLLKFAIKYNHFYRKRKRLSFKEYFLAKSFKDNNIDVVLAEYGITGVEVMNVCHTLNIPLIVHFHGFDITGQLENYRSRYVQLIDRSKFVVGVSKDMVKTLQKLGFPKSKTIYSPCGPDSDFKLIRPSFNSKNFISVGRFTDKKAPYYTILAFNEAIKRHPDAHLYMAGTGDLLNTCINLAKFLKLEEKIDFLGIQKPDEIKSLMSNCIGFIQHSVTASNGDQEGTPVGIMEASLAGLPVISTYHAGIKDVIVNGKTGLLVEEHDVMGMAQNIVKIIENVSMAKAMGEAGKLFIARNFSLKKHLSILSETVKHAYED